MSEWPVLHEETHDTPNGRFRIRILNDQSPSSPREDTNLCRIIGWNRDYRLSDEDEPSPRYIGVDQSAEEYVESVFGPDDDGNRADVLFYAPLRLDDYGSGGVRLSIGGDGFDWKRSDGVVYIAPGDWNDCMGENHPKPTTRDAWIELIKGEIELYQDYINGNVYGYVVEKVVTCDRGFEHYEDADSCWGFMGNGSFKYALDEAREGISVALAETGAAQ